MVILELKAPFELGPVHIASVNIHAELCVQNVECREHLAGLLPSIYIKVKVVP